MDIEKFAATRSRIEDYAAKISKNENIPAQDLLKEGLSIRDEALAVFKEMFPRDKATGELANPVLAGIARTIDANLDVVRKQILEQVYKGEIDPFSMYEMLKNIIEEQTGTKSVLLPVQEDAIKNFKSAANSCPGCYSCATCGTCVGCIACLFTVAEVAVATETANLSAVSASAG